MVITEKSEEKRIAHELTESMNKYNNLFVNCIRLTYQFKSFGFSNKEVLHTIKDLEHGYNMTLQSDDLETILTVMEHKGEKNT